MKIANSAVRVIDSNGLKEESDFKILATAQSFRILSSGLYSDKISAVLREVGCNAMDSHIAAGLEDKPIEVKLPTLLSSEFYIKDCGLGLSPEEIKSLYTTYFSSNKGQSNDLTGAFGLGSKSPFSYTDSFSVTSAHGGMRRTYSAYIGKQGSPVISLLSEQPVDKDWPHGVMVSFPVKNSDIREFSEKAHQVFRWFNVKPVHPGSNISSYQDPEKRFEGSNFFFLKGTVASSHWNAGHRVVPMDNVAKVLMGNVAYPLDSARLGSQNRVVNALISSGIHLRMPLGSVMPTASREYLEYDERTRKNIGVTLVQAGKELGQQIADQVLLPAPTEWERHRRTLTFMDTLPGSMREVLPSMLSLLKMPDADKNKVIDCVSHRRKKFPAWIGGLQHLPGTVKEDVANSYDVWIVELTSVGRRRRGSPSSLKHIRTGIIAGKLKRGKFAEEADLDYGLLPEVYYVDDVNGYARIREVVQSETDRIIMIAPCFEEGKAGLKAYAEKVAESLGGLPVKAVSSLPPLPKEARASASNTKTVVPKSQRDAVYAQEKVEFIDASDGEPFNDYIAFGSVPDNARYYLPAPVSRNPMTYAVEIKGSYKHQVDDKSMRQLVQALNALRALGAPVPEIGGYIIPVGPQARKFKLAEKGWKSLPAVIAECLENPAMALALKNKVSDLPDLRLRVTQEQRRHYIDDSFIGLMLLEAYINEDFKKLLFNWCTKLPALSDIVLPLWDANVLQTGNKTATVALRIICDIVQGPLTSLTPVAKNLREFDENLMKQYPQLHFLDKNSFREATASKETERALFGILEFIFGP